MKGDIKLRSTQEVVDRIIALIGVFQAATGRDKEEVTRIFKKNHIWSFLTPVEQNYLLMQDDNTQYLSMQLSWRSEAVYILLWALKKLEFNQIPSDEHNLKQISYLLRDDAFYKKFPLKDIQLRDSEDILNMLDKIYRIHWKIRDAQLNDRPINAEYSPSIIYEWHYSLNWLTNANVEWDDITTDT